METKREASNHSDKVTVVTWFIAVIRGYELFLLKCVKK